MLIVLLGDVVRDGGAWLWDWRGVVAAAQPPTGSVVVGEGILLGLKAGFPPFGFAPLRGERVKATARGRKKGGPGWVGAAGCWPGGS